MSDTAEWRAPGDRAAASPRCDHTRFLGNVNVVRLEDAAMFRVEVRVTCDECQRPFRFLGLPWGMLNEAPTTDVTGLELNAPIVPWADGAIPERGIQRGVWEVPPPASPASLTSGARKPSAPPTEDDQ